MNVGMLVFEISTAAVDYNLRDLRRCGVVQIDEALAVYHLTKNRKVFPDALNVEAA